MIFLVFDTLGNATPRHFLVLYCFDSVASELISCVGARKEPNFVDKGQSILNPFVGARRETQLAVDAYSGCLKNGAVLYCTSRSFC